jgi:hypothetical protein
MEYQDYMNLVAAIVEQAKKDSYGHYMSHSIGRYCECDPTLPARTCANAYLRRLSRLAKSEHMQPIDLALAVLEATT